MNKQALERLYRQHFRVVWNICLTFLKSPSDTEDATQETFLRLVRENVSFQSETHAKAWLIHTAKNICLDELRRHRRRELPLEEVQNVSSDSPYIDETLEAVRSLPEKNRIAIYLYYYEGQSVEQISSLLNRKESTVRSDLRRGREKLKGLLERSKI
ncbi:MAG: RNA polymerase sigma factor [Oscillospiraceae bacterium]|nr:RNA polymerase sigma factor [Oscillospiraceae bacterium]